MKKSEMIKKAEEILSLKLIECKIEGGLRDTLYQDDNLSIETLDINYTNEIHTIAYYLTSNNGEIQAIVKIDESK